MFFRLLTHLDTREDKQAAIKLSMGMGDVALAHLETPCMFTLMGFFRSVFPFFNSANDDSFAFIANRVKKTIVMMVVYIF